MKFSESGPISFPPGLYVAGTPIGNLADVTARALEVLAAAEVILAEDTRRTRKLLDRHGIRTPLVSCHKFNEASRREAVCGRIAGGQVVALVSDSGMPGVSDPGARTVSACRAEGLPVYVVPGPSSVSAALAWSGFPADRFTFLGFLPVKAGARGRAVKEIDACRWTVVLFESPYRLVKLLAALGEVMPTRHVCVAREMTKRFEEAGWGAVNDVYHAWKDRTVKGECVVVLAPVDFAPPGSLVDTDSSEC